MEIIMTKKDYKLIASIIMEIDMDIQCELNENQIHRIMDIFAYRFSNDIRFNKLQFFQAIGHITKAEVTIYGK
jgi:uncharacterized protein YpuA (DUF1002 family)